MGAADKLLLRNRIASCCYAVGWIAHASHATRGLAASVVPDRSPHVATHRTFSAFSQITHILLIAPYTVALASGPHKPLSRSSRQATLLIGQRRYMLQCTKCIVEISYLSSSRVTALAEEQPSGAALICLQPVPPWPSPPNRQSLHSQMCYDRTRRRSSSCVTVHAQEPWQQPTAQVPSQPHRPPCVLYPCGRSPKELRTWAPMLAAAVSQSTDPDASHSSSQQAGLVGVSLRPALPSRCPPTRPHRLGWCGRCLGRSAARRPLRSSGPPSCHC